jgi:Methyltransferase domain
LRFINLAGKGLEIGPLGYPTVSKSEADISYLDLKKRDQLVAESSPNDEIDYIPETDYLVASNNYRQYVADTFDYIIANHVLEHIPDLIHWLVTVSAMLNPNGVLFIALPDKKYTFDKNRQTTRLSHILSDYYTEAQTISLEHVLDQATYLDRSYLGEPVLISERLDRARMEKIISEGIQPWMVGYHCHIFQSETILDTIFKPLILMGYVDLDLIDFVPAEGINYGEMMIIFRKTRSSLLDRPINLPLFFNQDYPIDTIQAANGHVEQDRIIKEKASILPSFVLTSKFAQKFIKPLYQRIKRLSH